MIARACYVQCDRCGDPAEVSAEGAADARKAAWREGFEPIQRNGKGPKWEDVCPRCMMADDPGETR